MVHTLPRPALALVAILILPTFAGLAEASGEAPQDLVVKAGENRLVLTWKAPVTSPDAYRVYRVLPGGDSMLAELPPSTLRYVDHGLADGETRTYAVHAVHGSITVASASVSGTTFAPTLRFSDFASGPDGFTTERSGGGASVGWDSSARAIQVRYTGAAATADDIVSRPLPTVGTDGTHSFQVNLTFRSPDNGWGASTWPLALTNAGTNDIDARPSTIGFRYEEDWDWQFGRVIYAYYRDGAGNMRMYAPLSGTDDECPCGDPAVTWNLSMGYDALKREIWWTSGWNTYTYRIGQHPGDGFSVSRVAVASDTNGSRSMTYTTDDVLVRWKQAEPGPTAPYAVSATRSGHTHVALAWSPPLSSGAEPVTHYVVRRGSDIIAITNATGHHDFDASRWTTQSYDVRAVSEIAESPALRSSPRVHAMANRHQETVEFDEAPPTWVKAGETFAWRASRISVSSGFSRAVLDLDRDTIVRYALPLEGAPWNETTGSFSAESVWQDPYGSGYGYGACVLAITNGSSTSPSCTQANSIAVEFRAEGRGGLNPTVARLRYTDASGTDRILVNHRINPGVDYRANVTYDEPTRTLTLRLKDAAGAVLASGSYAITGASDGFRVAHVGITAGLTTGGWGEPTRIFVDSMRYDFRANQPAGLPEPPTNVSAEPVATGTVRVTWTPSPEAGADYFLYLAHKSGGRALLARTSATEFVHGGLPPGDTVRYVVATRTAAGEGVWSTDAMAQAWNVPGRVAWFGGTTGPRAGQVTLSWGDAEPDPRVPNLGFHIHRDGALLASLPPDASNYTVADLAEGARHSYAVRAYNTAGSGEARSLSVSAPSRPGAPTSVTAARGPGADEVNLTWGLPSTSGGLPYDYVVYRVLPNGTHMQVAEPGTARTWRDTGLAENESVQYAVRARNDVGIGQPTLSALLQAPTRPTAPLNLTATRAPAPGEMDLKWAMPASNGGMAITGYVIHRDGIVVGNTTHTTWRDSGLALNTTYTWHVIAVNALGEGAPAAITATTADVPPAPSSLTGTRGSTLGTVRLAWTPPAHDGGLPLTGYRVYRVDEGVRQLVATLPASARGYNHTGLPDNTTVRHEVVAVNAAGEGAALSVETRTWPRIVPEAVRDLDARHAGTGVVRVSWSVPEENEGPPVVQYRVYRIGGPQGETLAATVTGTAWIDSITGWAMQPSLTYSYRVVAVNLAGEGPSRLSATASPLM